MEKSKDTATEINEKEKDALMKKGHVCDAMDRYLIASHRHLSLPSKRATDPVRLANFLTRSLYS